jgi:hypothetical protein
LDRPPDCRVGGDVLGDLRLHRHGLLEGRHRLLSRARGCDLLAVGQGLIEAGREHRLELAVEVGDLELDALGLRHQLVDLSDGLADRRKLGKATVVRFWPD